MQIQHKQSYYCCRYQENGLNQKRNNFFWVNNKQHNNLAFSTKDHISPLDSIETISPHRTNFLMHLILNTV